MGEHLLQRVDLQDLMESDIKNQWLYHAEEECDHSNTSFDIYKKIGGSYLLTAGLMPLATLILTLVILKYWIRIMNADRLGYTGIIDAVNKLIGFDGFITGMADDYFKFFNRDFHPKNI